jgi:hypothetical protein
VEESKSIKPNVRLRHRSRQGYGHGGEAGDELSEIGDEADMTFLNEKEVFESARTRGHR